MTIRSPARPGALLVLCGPLSVLLSGCPEPDNLLDGSIKDSRDLAFDYVQIRYISDQDSYDVQYLKKLEAGGNDDIVAKIAFTAPDGGAKGGKAIDLLDEAIDGVVQRNTAGGSSDAFPPDIEKGTLTFVDDPKAGEKGDGEFAATFTNGKTIFGNFLADVEEASFD